MIVQSAMRLLSGTQVREQVSRLGNDPRIRPHFLYSAAARTIFCGSGPVVVGGNCILRVSAEPKLRLRLRRREKKGWLAEPKLVHGQDGLAFALCATARHPSRGLPSRSSRFGFSSRERRMVDLTGIEPVTS